MAVVRKRFRIEGGLAPAPALATSADRPVALDRRAPAGLMDDLGAMRSAIATTKRELAALCVSPAGRDRMHRAACEIDAVSAANASAASTILDAVEEIELAANLLRSAEAEPGEAIGTILDRVLVLYEACNFQDIAGQRLGKVVATLRFVEERLDRLASAWTKGAPDAAEPPAIDGPLATGPSLPGDRDHVSQSDVDRYFT